MAAFVGDDEPITLGNVEPFDAARHLSHRDVTGIGAFVGGRR